MLIFFQFGDFKLPFMVMGGNALIFVLISLFVLPKDLGEFLRDITDTRNDSSKFEPR